jgi:hypothetical protein
VAFSESAKTGATGGGRLSDFFSLSVSVWFSFSAVAGTGEAKGRFFASFVEISSLAGEFEAVFSDRR